MILDDRFSLQWYTTILHFSVGLFPQTLPIVTSCYKNRSRSHKCAARVHDIQQTSSFRCIDDQNSLQKPQRLGASSQLVVTFSALNTASSFLGYESVDQSEFRFRLLVGLIDSGNLRTSILALHSTTCSSLELSFQFLQRPTKSFLLLASSSLL